MPQLGAAWRTVLGVRALANPEKFVAGQFSGTKTENGTANKVRSCRRASAQERRTWVFDLELLRTAARRAAPLPAAATRLSQPLTRPARAQALALRCGLLNLQVAALQVAACNAGMKTVTKRNLHAAMAINNFRHAPCAAHTRNILQANGCFPFPLHQQLCWPGCVQLGQQRHEQQRGAHPHGRHRGPGRAGRGAGCAGERLAVSSEATCQVSRRAT